MRRAAAFLVPHLRRTYVMFTFERLSYAEIAARLSIAPGTVATRVSRARKRLCALLLSGRFRMQPAEDRDSARRLLAAKDRPLSTSTALMRPRARPATARAA